MNRGLDTRAVDIERRAREPYLGQFNLPLAYLKALPEAQGATVEATSREILAQSAGEQRETLREEFVDAFNRD